MSAEKTTRRYQLRKRAEAMEATRRRITEAAVELHGTLGPARTTMTAVAERAGVQRQTVYRHFADEEELFAACSAHFAALHPWPDAGAGGRSPTPPSACASRSTSSTPGTRPRGRCGRNVLRDETLVAAVCPALAPFRAYLDEAARALAAGWGARGRRRAMLLAAARHAVDFHTWRSLARDGGVSRAGVVELTSAMVGRAAGA